MSPHFSFALVLAFALTAPAPAVEPWADPKLPVTDGLELWLDAARIDAAAKANKASLADRTASSRSGSMARGRGGTSGSRSRPRAPDAHEGRRCRDRALRRRRRPPSPHRRQGGVEGVHGVRRGRAAANLGGFRGFFALNAPNGRDYETGLNIDMGPNAHAAVHGTERRGHAASAAGGTC